MNGDVISKNNVRSSFQLTYLIAIIFSLFLFGSCSGTDRNDTLEHIDIYYAMGYVDSDGPCEKDFHDSEVLDKEDVYIGRKDYEAIIQLLAELEVSGDVASTYGMCLQSNFHFADSSFRRVCVGQFGDITVDGKPFARKDSLVYLLRKYSGFYNYYSREEVVRFCEELSSFGIPENYKDMAANLDRSGVFYAKVRILVE